MHSKLALPLALGLIALIPLGCEDGGARSAQPNCISLDNPLKGGGEGFIVRTAGRYCLGKDMSTRMDLPDRPEQPFLISIRADDVDLDLNGHTLTRGWNFTGAGKHGIQVTSKLVSGRGPQNVTIRNGTLRGFVAGVAGTLDCKQTDCDSAKISYDATSDTYHYAADNITVKNVKFENVLDKLYFSDGRGRTLIVAGDRR